jgi:HSP20 family protein
MMERYRPHRRTPVLWNPFREMEEMERMMDEAFRRPVMWRRVPEAEFVWSPSIEMYQKENSYTIRLELPGVRPEDVDISMSGDSLIVKGERKPPEDMQDEAYQLCEVCYGSFTRTINLPESVDSDKIEANLENVILDIRVTKAEKVKPKQIKVQSKSSQSQINHSQSGRSRSENPLESSESIADSAGGISEEELKNKSKIPYEA